MTLEEMPYGETLKRIHDFLRQHDELKENSMFYENLGKDVIGLTDSFNDCMLKARRWLGMARWNLRVVKLYMKHLEELDIKTPVKVSFT